MGMSAFPFPLPILTVCWGLRAADWTPERLAEMAKGAGFKSVAVQLGQATREQVAVLQAAGLFVVGWEVANAATTGQLRDIGCDGWAPQVEGPGEREALYSVIDLEISPLLIPHVVFTTYGGLDTQADVARLKSRGFEHALVECYKNDGHSSIDVMLAAGQSYGFTLENLAPVIGTFRGETLDSYTWDGIPGAWLDHVGSRFGVYNAEQTSPACWTQLAGLTHEPDLPPPLPPEASFADLRAHAVSDLEQALGKVKKPVTSAAAAYYAHRLLTATPEQRSKAFPALAWIFPK